jgi:hypothetical protein
MPPTQTELSKPAAATRPIATGSNHPRCCANWESRTQTSTTHIADATCCGAHDVWNSQPPKPEARPIRDGTASGANHMRIEWSDPAAASAKTTMAAEARPPIQTARPIISSRDANAVNAVRPASASQPLTPVITAAAAALKCQR